MIRQALKRARYQVTAQCLPRSNPTSCGQRRSLLTSSYAAGPSEPPLLQQTVPEHFSSIVSRFGDHNAVVAWKQRQRLTYAQLDHKSSVLARGLQDLGVKKGERVCVMLGNNIEFAITTYALFKLGAILVPLNPQFNSPQVISAMSHIDASHLIIGVETNLAFKSPRENLSLLKQITPDLSASKMESASVRSLRNIILVDNSEGRIPVSDLTVTTSFNSLLESGSSQTRQPIPDSPLHPDEIANIQFTSGTTSLPKAAALSHLSILNNGHFIGTRMGLTERDVICCPPPLFHCFGCILGYMATATTGASIVFPAEAFDPKAALLSIQEEKATGLYGVPTMFVAELELLASGAVKYEGFENLRTGIAAGTSIPPSLMSKLHNTLNLTELTICYGMTETSPVSCMTTPTDPIKKRLETVGKLLPHTACKVVDPADPHVPLPIGARGELCVSGYLLMNGYWGDPAKTADVMIKSPDENGKEVVWMLTGDEASMDEEGYVKITGRIKDLIIRGGENIAPLDIEDVLFAHDKVAQASVVGVPDEKYGECVAAFVCVHAGTRVENDPSAEEKQTAAATSTETGAVLTRRELREWVHQKLSRHLVPKYIFWTQDFPKTASGKIQKFKLQEDAKKYVAQGRGI